MKKNVVKINNIEQRASMLVEIPPNKVKAAVFLVLKKMATSIPIPLSQCPKVRRTIRCSIVTIPHGEILGEGMSFCRPPDKFNSKRGAALAFRRAVNSFCESAKFKNYYGPEFEARRNLWEQFKKTKAWKRVTCAKKTESTDSQGR